MLARRTARRIIRRSTYPRSSFDGKIPSEIMNDIVRAWSATTRSATSASASSPYLRPVRASARATSGRSTSVSQTVGASCNIVSSLSNPAPVSMPCFGSGRSSPELWRS